MVSIALVAISAALALPSYQNMLEKRQLTSGVEQIAAFMNAAQLEAVRRNEPITIHYDRTDDDDWCVGAVVGAAACDCAEDDAGQADYCAIDGVHRVLNNADFGDSDLMHKMDGNSSFTYDPVRGILLNTADAMSMELHSEDGDYQLNIIVNATGEVSTCSKDSDHKIPGYPLCPVTETS
jgi:type IV fimbrial biogenesis protein FimT